MLIEIEAIALGWIGLGTGAVLVGVAALRVSRATCRLFRAIESQNGGRPIPAPRATEEGPVPGGSTVGPRTRLRLRARAGVGK